MTSAAVGCIAKRPLWEEMYRFVPNLREMALITVSMGSRQPAAKCRELHLLRLQQSGDGTYCIALDTGRDLQTQSSVYTYNISDKRQSLEEWAMSQNPVPPRPVKIPGRWDVGTLWPRSDIAARVERQLGSILSQRDQVVEAFGQLLKERRINQEVWVVSLNEGYVSLFFNWLCSVRRAGVDPSPHLVVMSTSASLASDLMQAGITAFHHPAFGEFSANAHAKYGYDAFCNIMHMKNIAVWLPLSLGRDVVFTDTDIVWTHDPMPYFRNDKYDAIFMGDASTARFSPFYANSGFFRLRYSHTVRSFWQRVLTSMDLVYSAQSQQNPLNLYLGLMHTLGLAVRVLSHEHVAGGETLLKVHWEMQLQRLTGRWNPAAMHENWTLNVTEKWETVVRNGLVFTKEGERATVRHHTCRKEPSHPQDERIIEALRARNITFSSSLSD